VYTSLALASLSGGLIWLVATVLSTLFRYTRLATTYMHWIVQHVLPMSFAHAVHVLHMYPTCWAMAHGGLLCSSADFYLLFPYWC
jgi:hypothetical protein